MQMLELVYQMDIFYQEALHKFLLLPRANSLVTISDGHRQRLAAMFQKSNQQIHSCLCGNGCLFMWGAYICMDAYKNCDVVVVIKMSAYLC